MPETVRNLEPKAELNAVLEVLLDKSSGKGPAREIFHRSMRYMAVSTVYPPDHYPPALQPACDASHLHELLKGLQLEELAFSDQFLGVTLLQRREGKERVL